MFGGCRWVFGWDCPKVVVGMTGHSFPLRSQYLLPTDPPNLSWSDGCLEPVEEELVEGEWELQVHGATTDGDEDGWHYAFGWEFNFHAAVTRQDLVRKRIWLRRRHHDVHAGPRREDDGGIAGWIRVILTPEEEGAVLERAGCQSGVVDEVQCVHADMGRLAQVEGKLVCPQPADRDKGSVKDLVYGNIAMVRVLSDSEASGDRQQGSTHQVWDGEEGSAHPMPEALEDSRFFTLPLPPIVVAPLPHRALDPAARLVLGKAPHTKPHHVFHVALGHERDAQRFVLASRGLFTVEQ